jgi:zinc/manganese transport system substrate-binding protein
VPSALRITLALLVVVGTLGGCSTASSDSANKPGESRLIRVVAAENFWGSIASQLGGSHVAVTNLIDSPTADPHDYEPRAQDGRAVAESDFMLINGIGYDSWATKLVAANPTDSRLVLTVGQLLGVPDGANPHRWYDPDDVQRVIDGVVADYQRLDPVDAEYFRRAKETFERVSLADYRAVIADIRKNYAGFPVGASESMFAMLCPALGLKLLTPPAFLRAISEGVDPTAADKEVIDAQIAGKQIKVYVYNSQNATPDVLGQAAAAKRAGIPVSTITETLTPATASWEQWQSRQLVALRDALSRAGR